MDHIISHIYTLVLHNFQKEREFFNRAEFAPVKDRTGSPRLMRTLCRELGQRIKERLPQLSSDLTTRSILYITIPVNVVWYYHHHTRF